MLFKLEATKTTCLLHHCNVGLKLPRCGTQEQRCLHFKGSVKLTKKQHKVCLYWMPMIVGKREVSLSLV